MKKKGYYIIGTIVLLIIAGVVYGQVKGSDSTAQYETTAVKKGKVTRTVEATGKVQSASDLSLRFETAGTLAYVAVKEGAKVKKGDMLANLNLAELNAAVSQALANLNQKLAGSTQQELISLKSAMDSAKSAVDKGKADQASAISSAESAVKTAEANLKLAEGGSSSKIVTSEYEDTVVILQTILSALDDALTQADNVLGVDNTIANDEFEKYLSAKDKSKLYIAISNYSVAKSAKTDASSAILTLTTASSQSSIDSALPIAETALSKMNILLSSVSEVLEATMPVGELSQSELDALKTAIATARTSITTKYTTLVTQKQTIVNAKNSYDTYKIAYDKAVSDLASTKLSQSAAVDALISTYNQAQANYQNKLNPAREVDVASYRAALNQAIANRDKATLKAPMDGEITKINKKAGEYVGLSDIMIKMVSPSYEIEVDVPETDISKISLSNKVTYTLDALGESVEFIGKIFSIDTQSTEIQDVVYYKVKIAIDDKDIKDKDGKQTIMPGMTANVVIDTDSTGQFVDVIYIPLRAVLTKSDGSRYVRVWQNNQVKEVDVVLDSRVDNGQVVIKSGLNVDEQVILSIKQ